jgi:hypothetical protein
MRRVVPVSWKNAGLMLAVGALAFGVGAAMAADTMSRPNGYPDFLVYWLAAHHASDPCSTTRRA